MIPSGSDVAGIVLAAGAGSRLGIAKALVVFDGSHLIERGIRTLMEAGCSTVIVVLGAASDEVQERCDLSRSVVMINEAWREGMGGSVRLGLAEAQKRGASAAVVLPVDQPLVTSMLVGRLVESWRDGSKAAVPTYQAQPGTPVVLDRSLWKDVAEVAVGDTGARGFLRANPQHVTLVACDDVGDGSDVDTEEDLRRIEALAGTLEERP